MKFRLWSRIFCWGFVLSACTAQNGNEGALPPIPESAPPVKVEEADSVPSKQSNELPAEPPPEYNAAETNAILDAIEAGTIEFTQFKGCEIEQSTGDAPDGWFLYAWNEARTVGLVLSIHQQSPTSIPMGSSKELSIIERDAFVMIEVGETIDTNFCVQTIQQIPMLTVLESQSGSVEIQRSAEGYQANIAPIVFRDQYSKRVVQFAGLAIPPQELQKP